MVHRNARLTEFGRLLLVQRITELGWPPAQAAESLGVSRATAYKWLGRYRSEGPAGLADRSSRPHHCPHALPAAQLHRVLAARRRRRQGPHRLGYHLGMARSTVYGVLRRHHMSRLAHTDRPSGVVVRYQRERPGELVHIDVKELGRIPDGGGHRIHGRAAASRGRGIGYDYVHSAVDDRSRVAFSQILADEKATTAARFLVEAAGFFADHGVRIERVLTDNAKADAEAALFAETAAGLGIRLKRTRRYHPKPTARWSGSTRPCWMSGPMAAIWVQHRTLPRLHPVAAPLQSPATTHLARRPGPDGGPRQQRWWETQLEQQPRTVPARAPDRSKDAGAGYPVVGRGACRLRGYRNWRGPASIDASTASASA
jgi:transposase IS481 family protein